MSDSKGAINKAIKQFAKRKAQISDIEAEINGGASVEIGRILSSPIFVRVNPRDPEYAKIQALLLGLFQPREEPDE